jgi:cytochrome c biogenesis protein CcmG, thiol:disulfide interchange protein DsbE
MVPMDELDDGRRPRRGSRTVAIVLALVVVAGGIGYGVLRPAPTKSPAGGTVPEFTLERLSGGGTISSVDLKGKPLIVNFWASWCDPCRREAPLLEKTWNAYRDQGLTVLGVDVNDAPDNALAFVAEHGITYPVVTDPDDSLAGKLLKVEGLPQTFFVDSDWRFQAIESDSGVRIGEGTVVLGGVTKDLLDAQLEKLLRAGTS